MFKFLFKLFKLTELVPQLLSIVDTHTRINLDQSCVSKVPVEQCQQSHQHCNPFFFEKLKSQVIMEFCSTFVLNTSCMKPSELMVEMPGRRSTLIHAFIHPSQWKVIELNLDSKFLKKRIELTEQMWRSRRKRAKNMDLTMCQLQVCNQCTNVIEVRKMTVKHVSSIFLTLLAKKNTRQSEISTTYACLMFSFIQVEISYTQVDMLDTINVQLMHCSVQQ
jgi:hypothetical protein